MMHCAKQSGPPGHFQKHPPKPVPLLLAGGALAIALGLGCVLYRKRRIRRRQEVSMLAQFQLSSPAFVSGGAIPAQYTCKGANVSPPLQFDGVPDRTVSLALVLHDPDAPRGDFLHWAIWNIPPHTASLPAETVLPAAAQGLNDFGTIGYGGPCPPAGTHHYLFDVYALDTMLDLPDGTLRDELMEAVQAHLVGQAHLLGTFSA